MIWIYGAIAATAAVSAEIYFRSHAGTPWTHCWPAFIMAAVVSWGIHGLLQEQSLVAATVVFSCWTSLLRVAWTLRMHDHVTRGGWMAFSLVASAAVVKVFVA